MILWSAATSRRFGLRGPGAARLVDFQRAGSEGTSAEAKAPTGRPTPGS